MTGRVLLLGATGTVGSELVALLRERHVAVRAATRHPDAATAARLGCETVEFDLEQPATFAPALAGIDRVFLIARPGDDHADQFARPLIDEMKRQGVQHVVNLTAMGTELRPEFTLRKLELHLEASGIAFTHLRPNWFMQIFAGGGLLAGVLATGTIRVPAADARISFIDARDVAAVAAATLTEPGHLGKAYTLTGGAALDHGAVAREIAAAANRSVHYQTLTEDEARAGLAASGFSPERIERLIQFYRLVRQGGCASVSDDVQNILGRSPFSFGHFAHDYASVWKTRM